MNPNFKYYFCQICAIPFVVAGMLGGMLLASVFIGWLEVDDDVGRAFLNFAAMAGSIRMLMFLVGYLLEKLGFLPSGASRVYPNATSWGEYLKRSRSPQG